MNATYATRSAAAHDRQKNEQTVSYLSCRDRALNGGNHACLYSDGTIIPAYPHTCGATVRRYQNVWKGGRS